MHAEIIKELGRGKIIIRCDCGYEKEVYKSNFMRNNHTSCGRKECQYHKTGRKLGTVTNDLTGQKFGQLEVLKELGGSKVWVRCSCGVQKEMWKSSLLKGQAYSCGHLSKMYPGHKLDLVGQKFGYLEVLEPADDGKVLVRCKCGTEKEVYREHLLSGATQSCGCAHREHYVKTCIERYGDMSRRKGSPREPWQVAIVNNPENLAEFINSLTKDLGRKPTIAELCEALDTQRSTILLRVTEAGVYDWVEHCPDASAPEKELREYVKQLLPCEEVEYNTKDIEGVTEIDIYLPNKKIGIEFNGVYWHCSLNKDTHYHQNKSLACAKQGIRLIHIYEYEWKHPDFHDKIKQYLKDILTDNKEVIPARKLKIVKLDTEQEKTFLNANHLQGYSASTICYGLIEPKSKKVMSLMSFGKPRFDKTIEWEIIKYCNAPNTAIVGGAEKLFKRFTDEYKPKVIHTYASLDKFRGDVYRKLGFKLNNQLTKPGYLWVENNTYKSLTRYQTQKHKLVELGLGSIQDTEDSIMQDLGYLKIYDAGNLKFEWLAPN